MSRATQSKILEVTNLEVTLDHEELLRGITFLVEKGESLAIIGPNGAGKSLLFRALLGLIPHRGTITWAPTTTIGYVPQKFPVDRTVPITGREFFLLKSKHFWLTPQTYLDHLRHELSLVGLTERTLDKPVSELSGGQLQRLLIAWAMISHPDVLLFDEPTTGVDVAHEAAIYQIIERLRHERQTTVLLISHDFRTVRKYAQRALLINRELLASGSVEKVFHSPIFLEYFGHGHGGRTTNHDHHKAAA